MGTPAGRNWVLNLTVGAPEAADGTAEGDAVGVAEALASCHAGRAAAAYGSALILAAGVPALLWPSNIPKLRGTSAYGDVPARRPLASPEADIRASSDGGSAAYGELVPPPCSASVCAAC
jgi:hypothetical protein